MWDDQPFSNICDEVCDSFILTDISKLNRSNAKRSQIIRRRIRYIFL